MKLSKFANLLAIGLVLAVAGSGCNKHPGTFTNIPPGRTLNPKDLEPGAPIPPPEKPNEGQNGGIPAVDPKIFENYIPRPEILQADTVYFDFDSSVVKAPEKSKVAAVADYMKANPANAVRVEGHCDERGTEEYNRALGERRALAVREELVSLGADANHILTETFGKDRPVDPGHNEAAWKKNRRAEFIVLTPPAK